MLEWVCARCCCCSLTLSDRETRTGAGVVDAEAVALPLVLDRFDVLGLLCCNSLCCVLDCD